MSLAAVRPTRPLTETRHPTAARPLPDARPLTESRPLPETRPPAETRSHTGARTLTATPALAAAPTPTKASAPAEAPPAPGARPRADAGPRPEALYRPAAEPPTHDRPTTHGRPPVGGRPGEGDRPVNDGCRPTGPAGRHGPAAPPRPETTPGPLTLADADLRVPLVTGGEVGYANFDYAASAPAATVAADAVTALLPRYASVHRGAGLPSRLCTEAYEGARRSVARFLGCRDGDTVLFTRNTTDSTNLLAAALPADAPVVVFGSEHHATLLPWRRPIRLPVPDGPAAAVRAVQRSLHELRRGSSAPRSPVLVAVTGASNVTGEVWPVADIATVAHRYGARVFVDAAQLAPHRPIDVAGWGVDYLALSGHKLYAPFGTGVLAGRADWLSAADPYLAGGGATALVGDGTHQVDWSTGVARHEAGSPNVLGAVALGAVCDALGDADRAALVERESALTARLRRGLAAIDGVRLLDLFGPEAPRVGIAAFAVPGLDSDVLAAALSAEYGIGVRDGMFCAHPLTRRLLRAAGPDAPATAVRASIGLGTGTEHVDRLLAAVAELAAHGPRWTYRRVGGRPTPAPDPRTW